MMLPLVRARLVPLWCFMLLAMLSLPAAAVDWKLISETEDPDKVISWYVDMGSIVRDDDYLRAFLRTSWSMPQYAEDGTLYQSSTYLNYFDCDARKIAYTGNTYFAGDEPDGTPVHQEPENPVSRLKFQSVVPGSAGAMRLDFVCQYRSKNFLTRARMIDLQG
ncbi:MAG: hypothetical protein RL404_1111 [Pseudomonadota bacterium]|jgi:hypothetical protein